MPDAAQADYESLQLRIRDLEHVLNLRNDNLAIAYKLASTNLKIMGLLLSLPTITPQMMTTRLSITTDAKVAMHRLRTHLKPYGIEIHNKRGLGYWIEDADKAKIREAIKKVGEPPEDTTPPAPTPSGPPPLATFATAA